MNLDDVVFVAETKDAIYMGLLQLAMLVSIFICGYYFGSREGFKIDHGSCVNDEDEVIDDGSTFGPSKID
jgi:hypothetical protein